MAQDPSVSPQRRSRVDGGWHRVAVSLSVALFGASLGFSAHAQPEGGSNAPVLSSPLPGPAMAASGAGYHSPQSPIAPLPQRNDVVPWSVLADVTRQTTKTRILPVFNARQQAMHQTVQRVQGFMMPLDSRRTQRHFLLTSVPLTCSFCIPGGPESMVEVKAKTPVRYSIEPVVVEGRFEVLTHDPYGLFYRITDAVPVE
ncbi:hypothetical protein [Acidovorax lacteus]|uniref:hypothetical protein n=1 Tax=Acidovorax lacteus TaxID=1924988 RepID=UPI0031E8C7F6